MKTNCHRLDEVCMKEGGDGMYPRRRSLRCVIEKPKKLRLTSWNAEMQPQCPNSGLTYPYFKDLSDQLKTTEQVVVFLVELDKFPLRHSRYGVEHFNPAVSAGAPVRGVSVGEQL